MIRIIVDNKEVYTDSQQLKITRENPFIKTGTDFTLDVSFPLSIPENLRAFGITALQSYWLTECATIAAIDPEDKDKIKIGSCGHLVPGLEVKVINKDRDGIGEICLKGENVMKGYYKDEDATKETITDHWLHTGDIGYVDDDDYIYITGRI